MKAGVVGRRSSVADPALGRGGGTTVSLIKGLYPRAHGPHMGPPLVPGGYRLCKQ